MNINDIITLTNAGWTKDEIMSIVNGQQTEQQAAQTAQPATEMQTAQTGQPVPEQAAAEQTIPEWAERLNTKVDYVINRFNVQAVMNSEQPKQESVDDILAKLIQP